MARKILGGIDEIPSILPSKSDCIYTGCYCEENVWMMCKHIEENAPCHFPNTFVLFISNPSKTIPIWEQQKQNDKHIPVVWDYHVILLQGFAIGDGETTYYIYDLDTTLSFPTTLKNYVKKALRDDAMLLTMYHRFIRVVSGQEYLEKFASDRSHMKDETNKWLSPPPVYPCISTKNSSMNLNDFISMDDDNNLGIVFSSDAFKEHFSV